MKLGRKVVACLFAGVLAVTLGGAGCGGSDYINDVGGDADTRTDGMVPPGMDGMVPGMDGTMPTDGNPGDGMMTDARGDGSPADASGDRTMTGDAPFDAVGPDGCVGSATDPSNCGRCGNVCSGGQVCSKYACTCPPYQTLCGGSCIPTSVDPDNCGGCGGTPTPTSHICGSTQICSAGTCVAVAQGCLVGLTVCGRQCVDLKNDNNHCGACPTICTGANVCIDGQCAPGGVPVGTPPPGTCTGGGPPIDIGTVAKPTCAGGLSQTTFTWALCSCDDIALGGRLLTDAYDSTTGPYVPGGLGGGVGLNGPFNATSIDRIWGTLWSSSIAGFTSSSLDDVKQELHVGGPLNGGAATVTVGLDGFVSGDIATTASITFKQTLFQSTGKVVTGAVTWVARDTTAPVIVPPPCTACGATAIPVAAIVAARSASNDNALIALSPTALATPTGARARLDLPCGRYYLTKIDNAGDPVTIFAHGHTALFVDGDVAAGPITFALDPTATFDVFVTGVLKPWPGKDVNFGSANFPALMRVYTGGVASTSLTGGIFGGNLYAANGPVIASSTIDAYGSIYAGRFANTSETSIHFDRAILSSGATCPVPPSRAPDGGVPDGGVTDGAVPDGGGVLCGTCKDCGNQACVGGVCGSCTTSAQCCAPLSCIGGTCRIPF